MEIVGKRVLITGASRGLGRTLAFACAQAGAQEVLAGTRRVADSEQLALDAGQLSIKITPIQLDVTKDEDVAALARCGTVDVLINNAGYAGFGNPLEMNFDEVQQEVEVNYLGPLRVARAVAPAMIQQRDGMIVNLATAFARINLPLVGSYCATKAALLSLGQALRAYLSEHNVRVMTVLPTTIDTDMSRGAEVPKMSREFVASEILELIRVELHDPPIGDEAAGLLKELEKDPLNLERKLAEYRVRSSG